MDGFDERFSVRRGSDADLHFRLLESGIQVNRAPQALAEHPLRPAPWGASLLQIRHVVFDALLYKKHPALYRQKVEPHPCWEHYATVALLLLALAGLAAGARPLAYAAGAAWLLFTARLCVQRLRGSARGPAHVADMLLTSMLLPPLAVFWRLAGAVRYRVRFA
jgi:hypothetical protein